MGFGFPFVSDKANVPIFSPDAMCGKYLFFCSSVPYDFKNSAKVYIEEENGVGARALPSSSAITHNSNIPRPRPPYSSGIAVPVQPNSEI